jgi:threonine dehydrogenase-like Zn-dependent dehydrogenase
MKQIAQNYKTGEIKLLEVPVPACRSGGVLVRSDFSLISMGTEAMKIHESKLSLIGKARARPDQVKKVVETMAQLGPVATYQKVMNRLDSYTPLGYSLAGAVVAVGAGAEEFKVGQRVACGGNQFALHAEYNWVPRNMCVAVPDGVAPLHAAFTTVGSIAMQGFRQSDARLGETACVIGLGLVGQILVQILRAAGLQVVGIDVAKDRCDLATLSGAIACGVPGCSSSMR